MNDNERSANTRLSAVHSPASVSATEERRDTRALLLRACSLLTLAFVVGLAVLFLTGGSPQHIQLQQDTQVQAARSTMIQGAR